MVLASLLCAVHPQRVTAAAFALRMLPRGRAGAPVSRSVAGLLMPRSHPKRTALGAPNHAAAALRAQAFLSDEGNGHRASSWSVDPGEHSVGGERYARRRA